MKYDVFISYSTVDKKIAEGVCGFLESNGYRCFVAYRDIPRAVVWARAIAEAIDDSAMMVVVFSKHFNISDQTDREIELAADKRIPILNFRIANDDMTGAKKYYLKNLNWIDAFPNPDRYFGVLLDNVKKLLGENVVIKSEMKMPEPPKRSENKDVGCVTQQSSGQNIKKKIDVVLWIVISILIVLGCVIAIIKLTNNNVSSQSLSGVFTVSPNKKVHFSNGNLQYQASTKTWRFAEHQWDIMGDSNENISSNYNGWIDLFGWGKGSDPIKTSTNTNEYRSFSDWGNNSISNGGGKNWFALTKDEWVYVFDQRDTNSGIRYVKANVNGVNGMILLPDNWSSSNYSLSNTNEDQMPYSGNCISRSDWTSRIEANGAIFLPAGGYRYGTSVYDVGLYGHYWSATHFNIDYAYQVYFNYRYLNSSSLFERNKGLNVRLVCDVEE